MSSEAGTVLRRLPVAQKNTLNPWHLLWAHIMLLNKGVLYLHSLGPAWRGADLSTEPMVDWVLLGSGRSKTG